MAGEASVHDRVSAKAADDLAIDCVSEVDGGVFRFIPPSVQTARAVLHFTEANGVGLDDASMRQAIEQELGLELRQVI